MNAEKIGLGTGEERLINWAGWKRDLQPVDPMDAKAVDKILNSMGEDVRQAVRAVYVEFPKQSIYFVAAELAMPPTWINRTIERAKNALRNTGS